MIQVSPALSPQVSPPMVPAGDSSGDMQRNIGGDTCALGSAHPPGLPTPGGVDTVCFPTPLTQRLKKQNCEWGRETRCPSGKRGVQGVGRESEEEGLKRSELKKEEGDSEEGRGEREEEEERKVRKEKKQQMSPPPYRADVGAWRHPNRRGTSAGSRKKPQRPEGHGERQGPQGARQQQQLDDSARRWRGEGA